MTSALKYMLKMKGEDVTEYEKLGLYDLLLPQFASSFLAQFPTIGAAVKKYSRLVPASDFFSPKQRSTVEGVLELTVEEADALIKARPLVMEFKDNLVSHNTQLNHMHGRVQDNLPSKPKQKGRYRLTQNEIRGRKKIVKEAEKVFKESVPKKTWKQIADEFDIPERTLRDWRHNPIYQ